MAQDYDDPPNLLPRYTDALQLQDVNVRQMRGIMNHYGISLRDQNNNILPAFRAGNGRFDRHRQPYIDAILQHFRQQPNQPPPQPAPNIPQQPPNNPPQQPQQQNINIVDALRQLMIQLNESKEQKFDKKFHGKKDESIQDFIKYCKTYKELYGKSSDWIYKKILTFGLQDYAARVAHDNRGITFYDLDTLFDWLYLQFYGEEQLDKKKELWETFRQEPRENIDSAYHRYLALLNDYKVAISFAAERGANSILNVPPTEKESFTCFFNGLYKETQLILLTQIETQQKAWNLQSIKEVMRSVKALTVSSHGLNLKYSHNSRRYRNNPNFDNTNKSQDKSKAEKSVSVDSSGAKSKVNKPQIPRKDTRRCYNCNEIGHIAPQCPKKKSNQVKSQPTSESAKEIDKTKPIQPKAQNYLINDDNNYNNHQGMYYDHFMMEVVEEEDEDTFDEEHASHCNCWKCSHILPTGHVLFQETSEDDLDVFSSSEFIFDDQEDDTHKDISWHSANWSDDENALEDDELTATHMNSSWNNTNSSDNKQAFRNEKITTIITKSSENEDQLNQQPIDGNGNIESTIISVNQPKETVAKGNIQGSRQKTKLHPRSNQSKIDKMYIVKTKQPKVKDTNFNRDTLKIDLEFNEFMKRKATRFKN